MPGYPRGGNPMAIPLLVLFAALPFTCEPPHWDTFVVTTQSGAKHVCGEKHSGTFHGDAFYTCVNGNKTTLVHERIASIEVLP